jgi:hypothetical protein
MATTFLGVIAGPLSSNGFYRNIAIILASGPAAWRWGRRLHN